MQATDTKTSSSSSYPLPVSIPKILTRSFQILGVQTDAFVQIFADRIFFGISQLEGGKIGTYVLCEAETSQVNPKQTEYHLSTLLGNREDTMLGVYARTLHEKLQELPISASLSVSSSAAAENANNDTAYATNKQPTVILLGISLDKVKGKDPKMFRYILDILVDMYVDVIKDKPEE